MCRRHSFILTRAGKVHDGLGLTDSHTTIRELAGLDTNDSTTYAFEWQPPAGWPDADFNAGLTQDTAPIPAWEMKKKHLSAIERHLKKLYPSMDVWNAPDATPTSADLKALGWRLLVDGESVTLGRGDRAYVTGGSVAITGQTGGYVWGDGSSTITSSGQTGGDVRGDGSSTITSSGQTGGYVRGDGSSTITKE